MYKFTVRWGSHLLLPVVTTSVCDMLYVTVPTTCHSQSQDRLNKSKSCPRNILFLIIKTFFLSIPPDIPVVDADQMSPSEQQQDYNNATTHVRSASDVHLTESLPLKRKIKPVVRWSDESLTPRYACLAGTNEVPDEPNTPEEAINSAVWKAAMMEELSSLERNDTWELCSLPLGKKSIKCKWVFKLKQNADQFAKGFTQQAGIDYEETYSPVVRHDSLRVIFSVAAQKDLEMSN